VIGRAVRPGPPRMRHSVSATSNETMDVSLPLALLIIDRSLLTSN
jgi:hypothetical protein